MSLLLLTAALLAQTMTPAPAIRSFGADHVVPISVNGVAGTMRVDPGAPTEPECNSDFAERAQFPAVRMRGIADVGPLTVAGFRAEMPFVIDGMSRPLTVSWTPANFIDGADCAIGPGGLGAPIIRFVLHAPQPGERQAVLPIIDQPRSADDGSVDAALMVAGRAVAVRFDLMRGPTVLTANAARSVAAELGGYLDGPVTQADIALGVARPVQRLVTGRPLSVGPLRLDRLYARVSDYGDASGIRRTSPDEALQPGDIVVRAKAKRSRQREFIRIGTDALSRCSSITYDLGAKAITLACI